MTTTISFLQCCSLNWNRIMTARSSIMQPTRTGLAQSHWVMSQYTQSTKNHPSSESTTMNHRLVSLQPPSPRSHWNHQYHISNLCLVRPLPTSQRIYWIIWPMPAPQNYWQAQLQPPTHSPSTPWQEPLRTSSCRLCRTLDSPDSGQFHQREKSV